MPLLAMSDLNIIVYENGCKTPDHEVLACIRKAFKLGFNTLALNVIIGESELSTKQPLPKPIKFDIPEFCLKEARSQGRTLKVWKKIRNVYSHYHMVFIYTYHYMSHYKNERYLILKRTASGKQNDGNKICTLSHSFHLAIDTLVWKGVW